MQFFKTFHTILLAGALAIPVISLAAQSEEKSTTTTTTTTTETQRYYDSGTKEYHQWTPTEDRAYRMYLDEQRREYKEFPKITVQEQTEYWKWRHNHPDKLIFKSETEERHEPQQ